MLERVFIGLGLRLGFVITCETFCTLILEFEVEFELVGRGGGLVVDKLRVRLGLDFMSKELLDRLG